MANDRKSFRFLEKLLRNMAERDLLDSSRTVDEVVDERFNCPTPKIREQIKAKVQKWRNEGKVNWKERIEE